MTAAEAVAQALAAAGLGLVRPPTAGANLFLGMVRPPTALVPAQAVFVTALGGPRNNPLTGGGTLSNEVHLVQVRVRAQQEAWSSGETLATAAHGALHARTSADFPLWIVEQPAPITLGEDSQGFPEWSFTVRLGVVR